MQAGNLAFLDGVVDERVGPRQPGENEDAAPVGIALTWSEQLPIPSQCGRGRPTTSFLRRGAEMSLLLHREKVFVRRGQAPGKSTRRWLCGS